MTDIVDELRNRYMDTKQMVPCELEHRAAQEIEYLRQQLADSEAERLEQARLLGMSGEREARLLAEIERLKKIPMKYRRMAFNAQLQDENNELRKQLAASQAREQQLREALYDTNDFVERNSNRWDGITGKHPCVVVEASRAALALPQDTSALESMIAKAGEVMRERCLFEADIAYHNRHCCEEIRALPGVTLEDLK